MENIVKVVEILWRHKTKTKVQARINTANPQPVLWKKLGINICFTFRLAAYM